MTTGFHGEERSKEGIESVAVNTWLKIRTGNSSSFLAKLVEHGEEGFKALILEEDYSTKKPKEYRSFVPYGPMIFSEVPESEINDIFEKASIYNRYLGQYVVVGLGSGNDRHGRLKELHNQGIFLNPYIHKNLGTDFLELRTGDNFISEKNIIRIKPCPKKEIEAFVTDYNRQLKAHRKEASRNKPQNRRRKSKK